MLQELQGPSYAVGNGKGKAPSEHLGQGCRGTRHGLVDTHHLGLLGDSDSNLDDKLRNFLQKFKAESAANERSELLMQLAMNWDEFDFFSSEFSQVNLGYNLHWQGTEMLSLSHTSHFSNRKPFPTL